MSLVSTQPTFNPYTSLDCCVPGEGESSTAPTTPTAPTRPTRRPKVQQRCADSPTYKPVHIHKYISSLHSYFSSCPSPQYQYSHKIQQFLISSFPHINKILTKNNKTDDILQNPG